MNKSDSIVIIPTYNEKENIEKIRRLSTYWSSTMARPTERPLS